MKNRHFTRFLPNFEATRTCKPLPGEYYESFVIFASTISYSFFITEFVHKQTLENFHFRWLKIYRIVAAFPMSITLFFNHLKQKSSQCRRVKTFIENQFKIPKTLPQITSSDPKRLKRVKRLLEISDILDIIRTCPGEFFIYSVILSEFKNVFNPHCPANLLFSSIIRSYSCLFMTNQSVHTPESEIFTL